MNQEIFQIANEIIYSDNFNLNRILKNYKFVTISNKEDLETYKESIKNKIIESHVIIINHLYESKKDDDLYIIIGLKDTIVIIEQSSISLMLEFLSQNITICFLSDIKEIFDKKLKIPYNESKCNESFQNDINSINMHIRFQTANENPIFQIIKSCISAFLLKESHSKLKNRIDLFNENRNFLQNDCANKIIKENEFIELHFLGSGSSEVCLIYHIKNCELYAIKKNNICEKESDIVSEREIKNYSKMNYPLIPKFIGKLSKKNDIIIEYIEGYSLLEIQKLQLNENEKFTIIFELLMTFEFLHSNKFIYRDLKPSNVIIDHNKTAVLIDLDRMIDFNETPKTGNVFISNFSAPEVSSDSFSYEIDIYSLGQLIYYILTEKYPIRSNTNIYFHSQNISEIYNKCTQIDPKERPSISELIYEFYSNFKSLINISHLVKNFIQKISSKVKQVNKKKG